MNESCNLQYTEEHYKCIYYADKETRILFFRTMHEGEYTNLSHIDSHMLFFVIEGEIKIKFGKFKNSIVSKNRFLFVESGHSVLINATQETTIMWCTLNEQKTLCNEYSFKDLIAHYKRSKRHWSIRENELFTLPVNSLVRQELIMAYEATTRGMLCIHYQKLKMNLIMLLLRGFYTKDDLAHLFYPILNEENEFRHAVLTAYNDQINVQELMDALNLPESTFNRKFIKVFGTTAGKFITNRKKNHILRDLLMTDLSVKEISEKFKFTPSYIVKFSKNYFGKTPTELRSERHGK